MLSEYKQYPNKKSYDMTIPANIFQTWHSKKLPPKMYYTMKLIKQNNPNFKIFLFDDNDCRKFIQDNFDSYVLNAYDRLIPGAYKADLWRYCVLYIHGGIYMDVKYYPINKFKLINLLEEEHWVLDNDGNGVYNALMVCKAKNEILLKAIYQIVENVKNKYYGNSFLEPTGPGLLAKYFTNEEKSTFKIKHILKGQDETDKYILFNNFPIFRCYSGYTNDRNVFSPKKHYSILWNKRRIYL